MNNLKPHIKLKTSPEANILNLGQFNLPDINFTIEEETMSQNEKNKKMKILKKTIKQEENSLF